MLNPQKKFFSMSKYINSSKTVSADIMSWLLNFGVLNYNQLVVAQLWTGLNRLLEPIYEPIRGILPDTRPLDLAPLVAFVIIIALRNIILPAVFLSP